MLKHSDTVHILVRNGLHIWLHGHLVVIVWRTTFIPTPWYPHSWILVIGEIAWCSICFFPCCVLVMLEDFITKANMLPQKDIIIPWNRKVDTPPGYFEFLIPRSQHKKKDVKTLSWLGDWFWFKANLSNVMLFILCAWSYKQFPSY